MQSNFQRCITVIITCITVFNFCPVVKQNYNTYGDQEDIIRGNAGILRCKIPSFMADFLEVVAWMDNDGNTYSAESKRFDGIFNSSNMELCTWRVFESKGSYTRTYIAYEEMMTLKLEYIFFAVFIFICSCDPSL